MPILLHGRIFGLGLRLCIKRWQVSQQYWIKFQRLLGLKALHPVRTR